MSLETKHALTQWHDPPAVTAAQTHTDPGTVAFSLEEFAVMELEERRELGFCCDCSCTTNICPPITNVCPGGGGGGGDCTTNAQCEQC